MEVSLPFGPPNRCRNGECGELVGMFCRYQHYCCGCAASNLGLRDGVPVLRITMALRRRRRLVGRLLHHHLANPPPCVAKLMSIRRKTQRTGHTVACCFQTTGFLGQDGTRGHLLSDPFAVDRNNMQVSVITTHGLRAPRSSMGFLRKEFCFLSRTHVFCDEGEFEKALASTMRAPPRMQ